MKKKPGTANEKGTMQTCKNHILVVKCQSQYQNGKIRCDHLHEDSFL